MTTHILDLPPELLLQILGRLVGPDIAIVCQTCRKLREVCSVDGLWQIRCKEEFGYPAETPLDYSFFTIYSKVLRQYGNVVGLWKRNLPEYGGLVWIRYDRGRILASELLAPVSPKVHESLRQSDLFSISLNSSEEVELTCCAPKEGHRCSVEITEEQDRGKRCTYSCIEPGDHLYYDTVVDTEDEDTVVKLVWLWLQDEEGEDFDMLYRHTYWARGHVLIENLHKYELEPLILQQAQRDVPIQPGLFKGTYSAHGIEILAMEYNQDHTSLQLLKITGDPNVPAGQISVKADILHPMIVTLDQQQLLDNLLEVDTAHVEPGSKPSAQPFCLPNDCYERSGLNLPKTCKFRCHAKGQIAGHGFCSPSWCPAHLMVFDEDTFGVMWLQLSSFSLYSRVKEKLL